MLGDEDFASMGRIILFCLCAAGGWWNGISHACERLQVYAVISVSPVLESLNTVTHTNRLPNKHKSLSNPL